MKKTPASCLQRDSETAVMENMQRKGLLIFFIATTFGLAVSLIEGTSSSLPSIACNSIFLTHIERALIFVGLLYAGWVICVHASKGNLPTHLGPSGIGFDSVREASNTIEETSQQLIFLDKEQDFLSQEMQKLDESTTQEISLILSQLALLNKRQQKIEEYLKISDILL